jgi:hypothetical protein
MGKLHGSLRTGLQSTCSELLGVDLWVEWVQAAAPLPDPLSPAHRDSRDWSKTCWFWVEIRIRWVRDVQRRIGVREDVL